MKNESTEQDLCTRREATARHVDVPDVEDPQAALDKLESRRVGICAADGSARSLEDKTATYDKIGKYCWTDL